MSPCWIWKLEGLHGMMRSKPTGFQSLILLIPQGKEVQYQSIPAYSYSRLTNYIPKRTPLLASTPAPDSKPSAEHWNCSEDRGCGFAKDRKKGMIDVLCLSLGGLGDVPWSPPQGSSGR